MVLKHKTQLTFLKLIAFVLSCGGPTRTNDLQVMSLASYQLLHSAMCFLISSAKIAHFPRTAKQIADYFRENANVTVSLHWVNPFRVKRAGFFAGQKRKLRGKYCLLAGFRLHL